MRWRRRRELTAFCVGLLGLVAACGGSVESTSPASVVTAAKPHFTGRLVLAGADACPAPAWVFAGPAGAQDSAAVRADCGFTLESRYSLDDTARIVVVAPSTMKGFLGRVPKRYFSAMNVVGIPATWTITAGAFTGARVAIDLEAAFASPGGRASDPSFYLRYGTPWRYVVGSYAAPPVATAFCRAKSNRAIDPADSTAFWLIMSAYHVILGRTMYTPATDSAVCSQGRPGFELIRDSTLGGIPVAGIASPFSRDFVKGVMDGDWKQESRKCFIDLFCVQHEMTHGLGFGHTCSWTSIMESCGDKSKQSDMPTATDVAYVQLMAAVASAERAANTRLSLPQAHQFERVARGLTEEAVDVYEPVGQTAP
ncbi:MAG TPA: hypothetical protein VGP25_09445 [Gemmatimonadaceae bacterium]|nr:hypothetical protein [Gemmatimonadaceae bacterium]